MADSDPTSTVIRVPGVGVVVADLDTGTLTPRSKRAADGLGLSKRTKRSDERQKILLNRRRFEAYATNEIGRPDSGWSWRYEPDD